MGALRHQLSLCDPGVSRSPRPCAPALSGEFPTPSKPVLLDRLPENDELKARDFDFGSEGLLDEVSPALRHWGCL